MNKIKFLEEKLYIAAYNMEKRCNRKCDKDKVKDLRYSHDILFDFWYEKWPEDLRGAWKYKSDDLFYFHEKTKNGILKVIDKEVTERWKEIIRRVEEILWDNFGRYPNDKKRLDGIKGKRYTIRGQFNKTGWIDSEILSLTKDHGMEILKGTNVEALSGYQLIRKEGDQYVLIGGESYDLTVDDVRQILENYDSDDGGDVDAGLL